MRAEKKVHFTNWRELLTAEEVGKCQAFAAKIHWGFNRQSLTKLIERFERGRTKTKCKVFFILEDCNYHEVARLLAECKVKEAYEWANTQID